MRRPYPLRARRTPVFALTALDAAALEVAALAAAEAELDGAELADGVTLAIEDVELDAALVSTMADDDPRARSVVVISGS